MAYQTLWPLPYGNPTVYVKKEEFNHFQENLLILSKMFNLHGNIQSWEEFYAYLN